VAYTSESRREGREGERKGVEGKKETGREERG